MQAGEAPTSFDNFIGRKRELAELNAALEDVRGGRGRLFLIAGEPGIGKTRLAEEVGREAGARGIRTMWGRCWEGGGAPAYWPWIQVIRAMVAALDSTTRRAVLESEQTYSTIEAVAQIVPELHLVSGARRLPLLPPMDPEQARFRLFDAVATLLKSFAGVGPLVMILDDLHDADISSLLMLRFVARELDRIAMLIVGTYRDFEVQRAPELAQQIGDLSREARSLLLTGFSEAEVGQFYRAMAGQAPEGELASRLHSATAGNPLFVDGIVRDLVSEREGGRLIASREHFRTPHTLREAIRRRLATLSNETRTQLNVAAAIGNEFETEIWWRVAGIAREKFNSRLDQATSSGIVVAQGEGHYRFVHALIRAAVYEALDTNTRLQLHRAVAIAIEEAYATNLSPHLAVLAHHYRAAGVSEKAIDYTDRAARAARAVFAYAVAAAHWREALALSEGQNNLRRADMLRSLGEVAAFFLDPSEGVARLEESLRLYRGLQDDEKVAVANATLGLAIAAHPEYAPGMNVPRALEHFRQAQAWKGEWTDLRALGWLHYGMAIALFQAARIDEAIAAAKQATHAFERASNPTWVQSTSFCGQLLMVKGRHAEAVAVFNEVCRVVQEVRDPEVFRTAMWSAGWYRLLMRDPIEAKRFFTTGMERPGLSPYQRAAHLEFLALTELVAGDLSRAKTIAAEHRVNPTFRSAIAFREGAWEDAIEMQLEMLQWARRTGHRWDETNTLSILFEIVAITGDLSRATEILHEALAAYAPSDVFWEIRNRPEAALLAIAAGRIDKAIAHLEACREIIARGEDWLGRAGLVARAEGVVAAAQGREFTTHFENSIRILKRYALPFDEADTLDYWGCALLAAGDAAGANRKFDAAIEIYRRCGAGQRWIDRVEAHRSNSRTAARTTASTAANSMFKREGDWLITHDGQTFRMRGIKGLAYIAHLLGRPGERVHVIDMVQAIEGGAATEKIAGLAEIEGMKVQRGLGDAGQPLDPQAREEYRRRRDELRVELEDAQGQNDLGRIEGARHELEVLTDELSAAIGRGGRARKNLAHGERARSLVTKHIRTGLELIRRHDARLGDHLNRSIRTGAFCAYLPAADEKIAWEI